MEVLFFIWVTSKESRDVVVLCIIFLMDVLFCLLSVIAEVMPDANLLSSVPIFGEIAILSGIDSMCNWIA
ncbi:hypothetical protein C461_04647 [Halorubrum aidingense JCM 13560]|uniref:Uncharacterized protein n=1 Tax=Halorubrum aidingense JCM 13560 TaxID=1230454 RepID=M0PJG1_9EURY|nr:hypothetical protein C461_04647 [Halorubrum aidingense JCM 13560]